MILSLAWSLGFLDVRLRWYGIMLASLLNGYLQLPAIEWVP